MAIKQINATYLVNEDRILFRFNTQDQAEYRLWLTRRVTLFLLAASSHLLSKKLEQEHSTKAAKALNDFEKEVFLEAAKTANAGQQAYESGIQFPVGSDALLVMDVSCSLTKSGEKIMSIKQEDKTAFDDEISVDFVLPGGTNLNLRLAGDMIRAMCTLLDHLRQQAAWGEATLVLSNKNENEAESNVENNAENDLFLNQQFSKKISIH